jgi:RNA polymerase sigma factor (sigma-70 family)
MAQNEDQIWFDLNLAVMEDDALVVLAKECEFGPARDELIVRYGSQTERLVGWLGHSHCLSRADVEDARQSAVFWTIEAINKYDTKQIGKPKGCSFRSFFYRVLVARFKDFTKHLRRIEGHYDRSARSDQHDAAAAGVDPTLRDPASIAETRESINRLQSTLVGLDSESADMWQLLTEGCNVREIAARMGTSYDSAKRRRRKLIEHLKIKLNPSRDSADLGAGADFE